MASRHLSRSIAMQSLYEWDFYSQKKDSLEKITERNIAEFGPGLEDVNFVWELVNGVVKHIKDLDKILEKAAPEWPLDQIATIDRNILLIS